MSTNKPQHNYFQVLAAAGETEATILIYSYIGEYYQWKGDGWEQIGTTDIDFVSKLNELSELYPVINVRINSLGGEVFHGSAICTAIRNCKAEVRTWNDGIAASMAAIIWLCGHQRYMAKNALLMLHSASNGVWGNKKDMLKAAETLEKFDESMVISMADSTGDDPDEIRKKYLDGEDHWLTYNEVDTAKWLSTQGGGTYESATAVTAELNYKKMLAAYEASLQKPEETPQEPGIIATIKGFVSQLLTPRVPEPSSSPSSITDMQFDDFKKSIQDGTLDLNQVTAHLKSLEPAPAPAAPPAAPENPLQAQVTALLNRQSQLEAQVTALAAKPGDQRAAPGLPGQDLPTEAGGAKTQAQLLEEANAELLQAAQAGNTVRFTPAVK